MDGVDAIAKIWLFAAVFFLDPGAETYWWMDWGRCSAARTARSGDGPVDAGIFRVALTVGRALGTVLLSHVEERRVLRAGFGAGAAGIGLVVPANPTGAIAGALVTGLGFATMYPITRRARRYGVAARSIGAFMFSLASMGPAVIPGMVGITSEKTGSLRAGLGLPLAATVILFLIHLREW